MERSRSGEHRVHDLLRLDRTEIGAGDGDSGAQLDRVGEQAG
jgi:hypothetical protein